MIHNLKTNLKPRFSVFFPVSHILLVLVCVCVCGSLRHQGIFISSSTHLMSWTLVGGGQSATGSRLMDQAVVLQLHLWSVSGRIKGTVQQLASSQRQLRQYKDLYCPSTNPGLFLDSTVPSSSYQTTLSGQRAVTPDKSSGGYNQSKTTAADA